MGGVNSLCIGRCHDPSDAPENHLQSRHWRRPPVASPSPQQQQKISNGAATQATATADNNGDASSSGRDESPRQAAAGVDTVDAASADADVFALPAVATPTAPPPPELLELPSRPSRWSLRESFGKSSKKAHHRRNLSAAFSQVTTTPEDEEARQQLRAKFDLLELNSASEEQFMTLPGVNRATAANIVEHRRQIGAFRRVEDLALVPGIGGEKLRLLRPEVCVRPLDGGSSPQHQAQQPPPPQSQTPAAAAASSPPGKTVVSLNSANLFQLMRLPGVSQPVAEAIVCRRQKRGAFRCLDDVAAVPGVGWALLSRLRGRIRLDLEDDAGPPGSPPTSATMPGLVVGGGGDDVSGGGGLASRFSESQLCLLAECRLFDRPYARPPTSAAFDALLAGRPTVRVAAWNLNRLSLDKVSNPGVLEVICCTLLENALSIVAVQEVTEPAALQRICDELNNPTLPAVRRWRGERGQWDACVSETPVGRGFQAAEYGGFLFRAGPRVRFRRAAPLERTGQQQQQQRAFVRSPYVAQLSIGNCGGGGVSFRLLAASLHLKAPSLGGGGDSSRRTETEADFLPDLASALASAGGPEVRCLLLGDFNLPPDHAAFEALRQQLGYVGLLGPEEPTNVSRDCPAGSRAYDNLWASPLLAKRHFTGQAAVVRNGLCHPLVPAGWNFGGPVSDHCPVYAEFYTDSC